MNPPRLLAAATIAGALLLPATTTAQATPTHPQQADTSFLLQMHQGNLFELAKGGTAVSKGNCSAVRRLSAEAVRDHLLLEEKLRPVAIRHRVALPGIPTPAQRATMRDLVHRKGIDYDRTWLRVHLASHQRMLELIQYQLRHGKSATVKKLAREIDPVVRQHMHMARMAQRSCSL